MGFLASKWGQYDHTTRQNGRRKERTERIQLSFYRLLCYKSALLQCLHSTSAILVDAHSYFVVSFKCEGKYSWHDLIPNPRIFEIIPVLRNLFVDVFWFPEKILMELLFKIQISNNLAGWNVGEYGNCCHKVSLITISVVDWSVCYFNWK